MAERRGNTEVAKISVVCAGWDLKLRGGSVMHLGDFE